MPSVESEQPPQQPESEKKSVTVERWALKRMEDDTLVAITVLTVKSGATFELSIDGWLLELGIVLGGNGRLIDQAATAQVLRNIAHGQALTAEDTHPVAGMEPLAHLGFASIQGELIGVPMTNFGWQTGAVLIKDGRLLMIKNDHQHLTGQLSVIGYDSLANTWKKVDISISQGVLDQASQAAIAPLSVGFSGPLLVKDGETTTYDLDTLLPDPRFLADVRNFWDFGNGGKHSADFWRIIRYFLPSSEAAVRQLIHDQEVTVESGEPLSLQEFEAFENYLKDESVSRKLILERVATLDDGRIKAKLSFKGPFPHNRIPCIGFGHTATGELVVVGADKSAESTGLTVFELADQLQARGVVSGVYGSAGGDVMFAALRKDSETGEINFKLMNKTSNPNGRPRPVPAMFCVQVPGSLS